MSPEPPFTVEAEATALRIVAEALNRAAGLQEALDRALEAVMPLIGSEAGWIVLLEELGETRLAAARNLPPALEADNRAAMQGRCQCLDLLRQGHLQAAANIVECERLRTALGDTRGLRHHATVPFRAATRELGNLNLTSRPDRIFTDGELRLLTAVGNQVGIAIERAQLYEQVKARRTEEQKALLNLTQAMLAENDAQAVLDIGVRAAAESLRVELAAIAQIDPDGRTYSGRAGIGWPQEVFQQAQRIPMDADTALVTISKRSLDGQNQEFISKLETVRQWPSAPS